MTVVTIAEFGEMAGVAQIAQVPSAADSQKSTRELRLSAHVPNANPSAVWAATAAPAAEFPALDKAIETDVLIIGGGIAGTSTALHLAERGIAVVLLEAGEMGDGATGQSGGLIAPDYIRHTPETVRPLFGHTAAERLTRMIGNSGQFVFDLIDRFSIDCEARQDGFYTPSHNARLAEDHESYANLWKARGFPVEFLGAERAGALFGASRYCGTLHFASGGSLNPLSFVRGLAIAAAENGARLFAQSPAIGLDRKDGNWLCHTPSGTVHASRVVLAANGGNGRLHPAMRKTSLPLHVSQFASAPISAGQHSVILPEGGAFTDKVPYLFTARVDAQQRIISAFPASYFIRGNAAGLREARRRLMQHFDVLNDPQVEYVWRGTAWVNTSFLPEVYDLGDDAIAIQACNGRGIANNSIIGAQLAEMLANSDPDALGVTMRQPEPVAFYPIASMMPKLLMSLAYLSN